jgi:hypothetical protein
MNVRSQEGEGADYIFKLKKRLMREFPLLSFDSEASSAMTAASATHELKTALLQLFHPHFATAQRLDP